MPDSSLRLEVISAERLVFSDEVEMVVVRGTEGEMGILRNHVPLLTALPASEVRALRGGALVGDLVISGGFMEVQPDAVVVLADTAERADEIDAARAEEARRRAEARLRGGMGEVDMARAEAALRRALVRLKVARKRTPGRESQMREWATPEAPQD